MINYKKLCDEYSLDIKNAIASEIKHEDNDFGSEVSFLLLIDGLDEKTFTNEEHLQNILQILENAENGNSKIVFATRPLNFIEGVNEIDSLIVKYELEPLSLSKIIDFFYSFCEKAGISTRIVEDLKKSQLFNGLPRSPIATILLANLINENSKDLPSNLTELYSKYLELMLGRWEITKGLQSQKEYEALTSIVIKISEYFIDNDLDMISIDEAKGFFTSFLNCRNLEINEDRLFDKLINRSGIAYLNKDNNTFGFRHRSFCEYMFSLGKTRSNDITIFDDRVYSYFWRNIIFFYIGIKKDCEFEITKIFETKPNNDLDRFMRVINLSDYFLAGYASPYKIVQDFLPKLFLEFAHIYDQILKNKIDTPFRDLSSIQLLWFFQAIIKQHYGYSFFEKAIDHSLLAIDCDKNLITEEKINALFFVSATAAQIGMNNPYDFIIKNYKNEFSLLLGLGIKYEGNRLAAKTDVLKKYIDKIDSQLKKSHSIGLYSSQLHRTSVKNMKLIK